MSKNNVLMNAMYLYNSKNKIIKLFEGKIINPTDFLYNAKSETEPELYLEPESKVESEPLSEENIAKKEKKSEQQEITDMSDLGSEESVKQRKTHTVQGLKTLTPNQMLSRLPITLAELQEI